MKMVNEVSAHSESSDSKFTIEKFTLLTGQSVKYVPCAFVCVCSRSFLKESEEAVSLVTLPLTMCHLITGAVQVCSTLEYRDLA